MADLCAGAVGAVEQTALHNDAAADTGTQGGEDHVLTALSAALPEFAHGSHVGVVAGLHGETGEGSQFLGDVKHAPAQVDALVHHVQAWAAFKLFDSCVLLFCNDVYDTSRNIDFFSNCACKFVAKNFFCLSDNIFFSCISSDVH